MDMTQNNYKIQAFILKAVAVLQIFLGLLAAYYGPLEIYVFYLFSRDGPFFYEGFGVGSFWFALLVMQNMAYYFVAALLLPLGIGTFKLRRWARDLAVRYLWAWLVLGVFLIVNLSLLVPAFLRLDQTLVLPRILLVAAILGVALILSPLLLLRFYKSKKVRRLFADHDTNSYWLDQYPVALQALLCLSLLGVVVLHLAIFFQGMLPFFGQILLGRPPVYLLSSCIVTLLVLMYGIFRRQLWAWWGMLGYFGTFLVSVLLTFTRYNFYQLVSLMDLPAYEVELLMQWEILHEYNLAALFALPLLLMLGLLIYSRRYFVRVSGDPV